MLNPKKTAKECYLNSKGIVKSYFSDLDAGKYKVKLTTPYNLPDIYVPIKITKAKTIVKAPAVANNFKKSKYFKLTLKNKATKKAVSKIKVKVKVFTGKKSKVYTVKTNKKGVGYLNTNKLSKGLHKVVITSGNKNYKISAKSSITIK